jgi:hypothetical protein
MTTDIMKRWTRLGLDVCNVLLRAPMPPEERVYQLRRIRDLAEANLGVALHDAGRELTPTSAQPPPAFPGGRWGGQKGGGQ